MGRIPVLGSPWPSGAVLYLVFQGEQGLCLGRPAPFVDHIALVVIGGPTFLIQDQDVGAAVVRAERHSGESCCWA